MSKEADFVRIFEELKKDLQLFAPSLIVKEDKPGGYALISSQVDEKKKEIHFCAIQIKKNYVSFHLMPLYFYPELLDKASPELKKRMQGKTCFSFVKSDDQLASQLKDLVNHSFKLYQEKKMI